MNKVTKKKPCKVRLAAGKLSIIIYDSHQRFSTCKFPFLINYTTSGAGKFGTQHLVVLLFDGTFRHRQLLTTNCLVFGMEFKYVLYNNYITVAFLKDFQ